MQECVALCMDCHDVCLQMVGYLLEREDKKAASPRIRLLLDCAEMCQTAANFMVRGSAMHGLTCFVCSEICEATANECQQYADDPTEAECLDACRRCAESCRTMASQAGISAEYLQGEGHEALDYGEPFQVVAESAQRQGKTGRRANISDS
jgi:hypothetical protein